MKVTDIIEDTCNYGREIGMLTVTRARGLADMVFCGTFWIVGALFVRFDFGPAGYEPLIAVSILGGAVLLGMITRSIAERAGWALSERKFPAVNHDHRKMVRAIGFWVEVQNRFNILTFPLGVLWLLGLEWERSFSISTQRV